MADTYVGGGGYGGAAVEGPSLGSKQVEYRASQEVEQVMRNLLWAEAAGLR